jgi:hypothetical protein
MPATKTADDRKEAGPQPDKYDDGRDGSEPKEMDASKAAERDMTTINKSEGDKKSAAAKVACKDGEKCAGCDNCKKAACKDCAKDKKCEKHASVKVAEDAPMPPPAEAPAADAPIAPAAEEAPMDMPPPPMEGEANPEAASAEILTDEKKMVIEEKIEEAQEAIKALETEILEESEENLDLAEEVGEGEGEMEMDMDMGEMQNAEPETEEELDLATVFNQDNMEEKQSSLANEDEEHTAGMDGDFFAPSDAQSMEASLEEPHMATMDDFFSLQGSDADPLASLIASFKTAEQVAGMEIVESFSEAAKHFEHEEAGAETRDNESDHTGDLFAEAIEGITPEEQGAKRVPQDSEPKLEKAKSASKAPAKKKATLRSINPVAGAPKTENPGDLLMAGWGDFEE